MTTPILKGVEIGYCTRCEDPEKKVTTEASRERYSALCEAIRNYAVQHPNGPPVTGYGCLGECGLGPVRIHTPHHSLTYLSRGRKLIKTRRIEESETRRMSGDPLPQLLQEIEKSLLDKKRKP